MNQLRFRNAQRARPLRIKELRRITETLLANILGLQSWDLAVHFVSARRMAQMNMEFLGHAGSTDVITFDYNANYDIPSAEPCQVRGEIFISVEDAIQQAGAFHTTWQEELVRYVAHGILHLLGHDDLEPGPLKKMKREENRLMTMLASRFDLNLVGA